MNKPIDRVAEIIDEGYSKIVAKIHKEVWAILQEHDKRLKKLEETEEE